MFATVFVFGMEWTCNSGTGLLLMGNQGVIFFLLCFTSSLLYPSFLSLSFPESSLLSPPQWPEKKKQGMRTLNIDIALGLTVLTCELFTL